MSSFESIVLGLSVGISIFLFGALLYGFAEIIQLLEDIKNKL